MSNEIKRHVQKLTAFPRTSKWERGSNGKFFLRGLTTKDKDERKKHCAEHGWTCVSGCGYDR